MSEQIVATRQTFVAPLASGARREKKRWSAAYLLNVITITWLLGFIAIQLVLATWSIGLTLADLKCIQGTVFLIHKQPPESIQRGHVYAFRAHGLGPLFKDGTVLVKYAGAVAGDRIDVNARGVFVNGRHWGDLNPITLAHTHHTVQDVTRSYVVPPGKVAMLGDLPRSYDSRYWGLVDATQFIGPAWRLW